MAVKIELVFEEPPAATKASHGAVKALMDTLELLKEHPNTWAKVATWDGDTGAYGARQRLRKREFEQWKQNARYQFEVRKIDGGGSALYAKYEVKIK